MDNSSFWLLLVKRPKKSESGSVKFYPADIAIMLPEIIWKKFGRIVKVWPE